MQNARLTLTLLLLTACEQTRPAADPDMPEPEPPVVEPAPTGAWLVPPAPVREPERHRPDATACDRERPAYGWGGEDDPCTTDASCGGVNGRCGSWGEFAGAFCTWDACFSDAHCAWVCGCGSHRTADANACVDANCRTDADCGDGGYCSPSWDGSGPRRAVGYYCHTAQDECIDDADCESPEDGPGYCAFDREVGFWRCGYDYRDD